mmetsp:Transcript_7236/g.8288  ORF Transcript_7236/g.8288 Transcript_7236/m.8288 type:complete len:1665 (-) Transcript_7236:118-5112(-)
MESLRSILCLVVFLVSFLCCVVNAQVFPRHTCSNDIELSLSLIQVNSSIYPEARCFDNTSYAFYFGSKDENASISELDVIIWLGDTEMCSGEGCNDLCDPARGFCEDGQVVGECNEASVDLSELSDEEKEDTTARCAYSAAICGSSCWNVFPDLRAQTVLCEDDAVFGQFNRILLPSCSVDNWMGQGDVNDPSSPRYRGVQNFDAVVDMLIEDFGLVNAERIVLGGIRGAGIGALNLLHRLKAKLDVFPVRPGIANGVRKYMVIADSAWIINVEKFAPTEADKTTAGALFPLEQTIIDNSSDWLANAVIHPSCKAKFPNELHECFFPSELVKNHLINESVLVIQSQYDVVQMEELGIIDETAVDRFEDSASFAQAAITFIENYGDYIRASIEDARRAVIGRQIFFYSSACAQHGFIVPSRNHIVDITTRAIGDAGDVQFQRTGDTWMDIIQEDPDTGIRNTVRDVVINFISTSGRFFLQNNTSNTTRVLTETCGIFLCNENCKTDLIPFALQPAVPVCGQNLIYLYAAFSVVVFLVLFLLSLIQVRLWRGISKTHWSRVALAASGKKLFNPMLLAPKTEDGEEPVKDTFANIRSEIEEIELLMEQQGKTIEQVQRELINESKATAAYRHVHLMVENLSYWPKPKGKDAAPMLLDNVSVQFEAGKLHALLGPSGSGKSTLLEVIGLVREEGKFQGKHYINGVLSHAKGARFLRDWLKQHMSFVNQVDVFYAKLTAKEHLEHAAWLMLPQYMPANKKLKRVWQYLRLLDLMGCADTPCGDGGIVVKGGLSGGQRRRLSVCTQMLRNPALLLLDEPTTGLDSQNALYLMKLLYRLAHGGGVNVILTIHQPRQEIYRTIDTLMILMMGKIVFAGPPREAVDFFSLDRTDPNLNVGNDVLDIYQNIKADEGEEALVLQVAEWRDKYDDGPLALSMQKEMMEQKSSLTPSLAFELRSVLVFNSLAEGRWSWKSPNSAGWIQFVLLSRTLKRGAFNVMFTCSISILGGCVLGMLFFDVDSYEQITGLLYLTIGTITFLQGIFLSNRYLDEKKIFDHEWKSGSMRSWDAFILAQYARDAVYVIFETMAFTIPVYFLTGISPLQERRVNFFILTLLTGFCTTCQNILVQVDVQDVRLGASIQIGLLAVGSLFNGFIVQLDTLPLYFKWIPYTMLSFYGFAGALLNELSDFTLPCDAGELECGTRTGDVILRFLRYDFLDPYLCMVALLLMILIFRVTAAYDFYRRFGRLKNMKIIRADGEKAFKAENEDFKNEENRKEGVAITNLMNKALTPSNIRLRRQASGLTPTPSTPTRQGSTPSVLADDDVKDLSAFHLDSPETPKTENSKDAAVKPEFYIDEETGMQYEINYDEEDEEALDLEELDDAKNDDLEGQGIFNKFVLSRITFIMFFLIDLILTGVVCLDLSDTGFIATLVVFSVIYAFQMIYQIIYLIPYTDGGLQKEFVWASEYDFPSVVLFLLDISFSVQVLNFGESLSNDDSLDILRVQLLITLAVKFVRLARVQLYWYKVNKLHRVRAKYLARAAAAMAEDIEEDNGGSGGRGKSTKFNSANIQDLANRVSTKLGTHSGNLSSARTSTRLSGRRSGRGFAARLSARISNRFSNRGSRLSLGLTPRNPFRKKNRVVWQKFQNNNTGKTVWYNPATNEIRDQPPEDKK